MDGGALIPVPTVGQLSHSKQHPAVTCCDRRDQWDSEPRWEKGGGGDVGGKMEEHGGKADGTRRNAREILTLLQSNNV